MRIDGKSTRFNERRKLELPIEVYYSDSADHSWTEDSHTEEVTNCGLGFMVSRPVEPNHLINVRLPMPRQLRMFDYGKSLYDVWGLIRTVQVLTANLSGKIRLKIGVALIGENSPLSFKKDPETLYDLNPVLMRKDFWGIRELPRNWRRFAGIYDEQLRVRSKVKIRLINNNGRIFDSIDAETHRVNAGEIVVSLSSSSECSKYVVVSRTDESEILLAKMKRIVKLENSDIRRVHFEFLSGEWEM